MNRLAGAVSPYLASHADNPVDWWPWGEAALAEAARRDVPLLVSIGYATCHWCHVMARESFADPVLAEYLNARFVPVKVDREEHPDVDAAYLAAASAFTPHLGWPLTVFATPGGRTFYAGTYFPPEPTGGVPGFRQVLEAVDEAWRERRGEVEDTGARLAEALAAAAPSVPAVSVDVAAAARRLAEREDRDFGGFGGAPKFPVAPVLRFLAEGAGVELARRSLRAMAASGLRDADGGLFRYATRRDWSEPHYERMLADNAQLLDVATALGEEEIASGIADFLLGTLRLPGGAFATAQDSESVIAGARSEGGYYRLPLADRAVERPPALDEKVLTGLNGLAIGALAGFAVRFDAPEGLAAARAAADSVLAGHRDGARLVRASRDGRTSPAAATLEDYGALAAGLVRLALAAGEPSYAVTARELVDACIAPDGSVGVPGDPVLESRGLRVDEPQEGAAPSGASALADAALRLGALVGDRRYRAAAEAALAPFTTPIPGGVEPRAVAEPLAFGGALTQLARLARPVEQLVVVVPEGAVEDELARVARRWQGGTVAVVTDAQARAFEAAGFELFLARSSRGGAPAAYLCRDFVCDLPTSDAAALAAQLGP